MSDDVCKQDGKTILSSTVVTKDGAAVKVTRLNLSDEGKAMLRSKSVGLFTKSELDKRAEQSKLAAA